MQWEATSCENRSSKMPSVPVFVCALWFTASIFWIAWIDCVDIGCASCWSIAKRFDSLYRCSCHCRFFHNLSSSCCRGSGKIVLFSVFFHLLMFVRPVDVCTQRRNTRTRIRRDCERGGDEIERRSTSRKRSFYLFWIIDELFFIRFVRSNIESWFFVLFCFVR